METANDTFTTASRTVTSRSKAGEADYMLWEDIKKKFPDRFVLLENPVYDPPFSPFLKKGIFRYKNKSKRKVAEMANEMDIPYITIAYTGGALEENEKDYIFIF